MRSTIASALVAFTTLSCGGHATSESSGTSGALGSRGSYSLTLDVTLTPDSAGTLSFLSPSDALVTDPASGVVGKPYLVATFLGGFSPGNAVPLDYEWGVVPSNLTMHYTTPATYANGPYDAIFVIYYGTPITAAIESGPPADAPTPKGGDLAAFSLDESVVLPGDPKNAVGTIRLNVENANAQVSLANRTPPPDAGADADQTGDFDNTILDVP